MSAAIATRLIKLEDSAPNSPQFRKTLEEPAKMSVHLNDGQNVNAVSECCDHHHHHDAHDEGHKCETVETINVQSESHEEKPLNTHSHKDAHQCASKAGACTHHHHHHKSKNDESVPLVTSRRSFDFASILLEKHAVETAERKERLKAAASLDELNDKSKSKDQKRLQSSKDGKNVDYSAFDEFSKKIEQEEAQAELQKQEKDNLMKQMMGCSRDHSKERQIFDKTTMEKIEAADTFRLEGNEEFQKGDIRAAAVLYRRALIHFDYTFCETPEEEVLHDKVKLAVHLNMALVKLKMMDLEEAFLQCREALAIDKNNVKAYVRTAEAYILRGDFDKAQETITTASKLPTASKYEKELTDLQKRIGALRVKADKQSKSFGKNAIKKMMMKNQSESFSEEVVDDLKEDKPRVVVEDVTVNESVETKNTVEAEAASAVEEVADDEAKSKSEQDANEEEEDSNEEEDEEEDEEVEEDDEEVVVSNRTIIHSAQDAPKPSSLETLLEDNPLISKRMKMISKKIINTEDVEVNPIDFIQDEGEEEDELKLDETFADKEKDNTTKNEVKEADPEVPMEITNKINELLAAHHVDPDNADNADDVEEVFTNAADINKEILQTLEASKLKYNGQKVSLDAIGGQVVICDSCGESSDEEEANIESKKNKETIEPAEKNDTSNTTKEATANVVGDQKLSAEEVHKQKIASAVRTIDFATVVAAFMILVFFIVTVIGFKGVINQA